MDFIAKLKGFFRKIACRYEKNDIILYLEYAVVVLLVLFPLVIKSGYVFAPDMVFVPKVRIPPGINNDFLYISFLWVLNFIFSGWIIQKAIMFLILWLGGIGMHRLVPTESKWPKYFAGIFYIFNPFVYSRFMYGQWTVLIAYIIAPFAIRSMLCFFRDLDFKNILKLSLWLTASVVLCGHSVVFLGLFFAIAFLFYFARYLKDLKKFRKLILCSFLLGAAVFALNAYWVVPTFTGKTAVSQVVSNIDWQHRWAFRTVADGKWGLFFNAAAMYGFWGDAQYRYLSMKEFAPCWPYLFMVILGLVAWGSISTTMKYFKRRREYSKFKIENSKSRDGQKIESMPTAFIFIAVGVVSYVLAIGAAYKPLVPLVDFLNDHVPFYGGLREPHKLISLLVLSYCYLGALGVDGILSKLKARSPEPGAVGRLPSLRRWFFAIMAPVLFLTIPILYAPGMLWGFRGQLFNSRYPKAWFEVNEILNRDEDLASRTFNGFAPGAKTLFVPWHQYIALSFAGQKVIGNPAPHFFDKELASGDNMQMPGVLTTSSRPFSRFFEREIMPKGAEIRNMGELLAPWDIKYVIWAGESDFFNYLYFLKQDDLELVYKSQRLLLLRNTSWTPDSAK